MTSTWNVPHPDRSVRSKMIKIIANTEGIDSIIFRRCHAFSLRIYWNQTLEKLARIRVKRETRSETRALLGVEKATRAKSNLLRSNIAEYTWLVLDWEQNSFENELLLLLQFLSHNCCIPMHLHFPKHQ